MSKLILLLLFLLSYSLSWATEEPVLDFIQNQKNEYCYEQALVSILNKITTRSFSSPINIHRPIEFGNLVIMLKGCWISDTGALNSTESRGLLVIWERKSREVRVKIFEGWFCSSSPGLTMFEHPVYNINLISCDKDKPFNKS